ncbi:hypothetical protein [Actinoplanes sp. NPDC051851]|uniref:hypothetical protein n=1 Tax=Actinoplanes sp. NPDC051851 TaxID=3154753 RepID=UPI00341D60C0
MTATYDQWLETYSDAFDASPGRIGIACPNCGHFCLQRIFTGDLDRLVGYCHFWCDNCRTGIFVGRTDIPEGAVIRDIHVPENERVPRIPSYRLIQDL